MPKNTMVQTVLGPISTLELGSCLSHEHLLASPTGFETDSTLKFDYEDQLLKAVEQMNDLKAAGISSIVDPIPIELGRNLDFMADTAERSGINIIAATGLYYESGYLAGFPTYYKAKRVEELKEIFTKEITEGVGPRKIKPGIIKCATSAHEIGQSEMKALQAAAQAAVETGVNITTHTEQGTMGPEQVDIFREHGLDPKRVTVGHCSDSADIGYLVRILNRGAYIGFDRIGIEHITDDSTKVGIVAALVAMGYESQIMLSHDNVGCMHGFRPRPTDPKRSFTYLLDQFIPQLERAGVKGKAVQTMLIDNPRRFFEAD